MVQTQTVVEIVDVVGSGAGSFELAIAGVVAWGLVFIYHILST